jgi:hypothetical protein
MADDHKTLNINPEFQKLIDPLSVDERNELIVDLQKHGCIYPILIWKDTIIDGHNRYEICRTNNIPFETKEMDFEDDDQAKIWILTNQIARRNIDTFRRFQLLTERDRLKKLRSDRLKRRLKNLNNNPTNKMAKNQNTTESSAVELSKIDNSRVNFGDISVDSDDTHQNTQKEIAEELGVSTGTVAMMDKIDKKIKEGKVASEVLEDLRKGRTSVSKVYSDLKKKEKGADSPAGDKKEIGKGDAKWKTLQFSLKKSVKLLKDLKWEDVQKIEPLKLQQNITNEIQVINVRTNEILKEMRGE